GRNGRFFQGDGDSEPRDTHAARLRTGFGANLMSRAEYFTLPALQQPGLRHAFFTRRGGVSTGVYDFLNGGVGSRDAPEAVAENRARMAAALGLAPDRLVVPYQVHSAEAATISAP